MTTLHRSLFLLLVFASAPACVVKYGEGGDGAKPAEPLPAPVSLDEVESRLESLIERTVDVDQRDRLIAARDLSRAMASASPDTMRAVLRYLQAMVEVEERQLPMLLADDDGADPAAMSAFAPDAGAIEEEVLGSDGPPPEPAPVGPLSGPETLAAAQVLIDAGQLKLALSTLESCREQTCWPEVEPTFIEARDAYLAKTRDRAGESFIAARSVTDPAVRAAQLGALRDSLASVIDRYPDAPAAADLRRSMQLVQSELEAARPE